MIIATWNVRGMQPPERHPVVADFIKRNRVDVMGFVETKMQISNLNAFMARYFSTWNFTFVIADRNGTCRMHLLWNPQTSDLEVSSMEQQVIHTKIRCVRSRNSFLFSLVYGLHSPDIRQTLWDSLVDFGLQGMPYLVSGDFNAVMHVDERRGFRKLDNREMDGPIEACAILGLQDVTSTGCAFTWTNGHVFSKIDRAMVNQELLDAANIVNTKFLPSGFQTDH